MVTPDQDLRAVSPQPRPQLRAPGPTQDVGFGRTLPVEAHFDESARSIAWNRLWYKMLSKVLEAQRGSRPPDG